MTVWESGFTVTGKPSSSESILMGFPFRNSDPMLVGSVFVFLLYFSEVSDSWFSSISFIQGMLVSVPMRSLARMRKMSIKVATLSEPTTDKEKKRISFPH